MAVYTKLDRETIEDILYELKIDNDIAESLKPLSFD